MAVGMNKSAIAVEGLRAVPAVGVVCLRDDEVLLIRRGQPPKQGEWSIPGGKIEPGEAVRAAALRELVEETGVEAELLDLIDVVDAIFENQARTLITRHYLLVDYLARWTSGTPVAGDDAAEARFVAVADLGQYDLWDETRRIIAAGIAIARNGEQA